MNKIKLLSALLASCTLVACGGGAPESAKNKPDSLLPDWFVPASSLSSSSVASSAVSSAAVSSVAGSGSSVDGSAVSSVASSAAAENVIVNTSLPILETFAATDNNAFFTKAYKPLASNFTADPDGAFYFPIAGLLENRILVGEGKLTIGNARFSIGQTYNTLANSTATVPHPKNTSTLGTTKTTWGELDLSKKYKISFCVVAAASTGSMIIYVDNNSTGEANSIHLGGGTGSRIFNTTANLLKPGKRVEINIDGATLAEAGGTALATKSVVVGKATSFLQLRADGTAKVTIDDLWIGYQDDLSTEPAASTCVAGEHLIAPVVTSSSAASSVAVSSSTSTSAAASSDATSSVVTSASASSTGTVVSSSMASSIATSEASSAASSSSIPANTGWVCPTTGLYFCDDFAAGNYDQWDLKPANTNDLKPDGEFKISNDAGNNILGYTAAASGGVLALVKPSAFTGVTSADYYVEAKIRPRNNGTTGSKQLYIIARYVDGKNWYAGGLNLQAATTATTVDLFKMVGGVTTRFTSVKRPLEMGAVGKLDGQWYSVRVEVKGTALTVYLDGETISTTTDTSFAAQGLIGLWTSNKSFEIDDIKVGNADEKPASLLLSPSATSYAAEVEDAARVLAVTAKTDMGAADSFTVVSSNPAVVGVTTTGTNVSLAPLSAGTATITFTSATGLVRTIAATIAPKFVMPTATYNLNGMVVPAAGETNSYEDQTLKLTFDTAPTLGTTGSVRIFKVLDDSLVDTIKLTAESDVIGTGTTLRTLNTKPIRISGNTASISLHSNKLAAGTAYYVAVSDSVFTGATLAGQAFSGIGKIANWNFTTRAAAPAAGLTSLTVDDTGTTADFRSVQSALNYVMKNVALDTAATIMVKDGVYEEPLYLRSKNNLTIQGESRTGTVIQYPNNELLNSGSTARGVFLVETSDLLTLDTLTLKNTTLIGAGGQAETIYYNSPVGRLIAKNANFISEQDTLLLKGYTWFYQTLVAGNVDFIWGYSKASLFEQSEIRSLGRSSSNANGGYVLQARVENAADKGFVFLNSSLTSGAGPSGELPVDGSHYLARSPGVTNPVTYDNIVFINTKIASHINSIGWAGLGINSQPVATTATTTSGWREYGSMDANGALLDVSKRQFGLQLSLSDITSTFCSRAQIFAGFNAGAGWNPLPGDTTDCVTVPAASSASSSAPVSSSSASSSAAVSSAEASSSVAASSAASSLDVSSSVAPSSSSVASSSSSAAAAVAVLTVNFQSLGTTGLTENTETTLAAEVDAPTVVNTNNYAVKLLGKLKIVTTQAPPAGATGSTGVVQFANGAAIASMGKVIIKQVQCPFTINVNHAPSSTGDATRKLRITVAGTEVYYFGDGTFQTASVTPSCTGKVDVEAYGWGAEAAGKGVRIFDLSIVQ